MRKNRVTAVAKKPVRAESVVKNVVKVVEVDLEESEDDIGGFGESGMTGEVSGAQDPIAGVQEDLLEVGRGGAVGTGARVPMEAQKPGFIGNGRQEARKPVETGIPERYPARVRREPSEWYRAAVGATAEVVGAKETDHAVRRRASEKSDAVSYESGESEGAWVTPRAKRTCPPEEPDGD